MWVANGSGGRFQRQAVRQADWSSIDFLRERASCRLQICNPDVGGLSQFDFYSGCHVKRHSRGKLPRFISNQKDITMYSRKSFLLSLAFIAVAAPGLVSASSLYHPTGGEIGYTTHPEHQQSTKSRGEVLQAVEAARKDGTLAIMSRGAPLPMKLTGPTKTREQVQQEYLTMTESERQYRQEMYGAGS